MVPSGASTVRENYLDNKQTQVTPAIEQLLSTVVFTHLITLVLDGWTDINNTSVWVIIALLPNIGPIWPKTTNASALLTATTIIGHNSIKSVGSTCFHHML